MGATLKLPAFGDFASPGIWAHENSQGKWKMANHLSLLDDALVRAATTPDYRVIVEMPPRHGKSTLTSMYYPAWYRSIFPTRNIMLWGATSRLAQRSSVAVRSLCTQAGMKIDDMTHSWERWKLAGTGPHEGEVYAAGVGGGATMGAGGHLLVVDDFFKDVEAALSEVQRAKLQEWYLTSCITRAEPGASVVILATRWHVDDLIGFVLKEAERSGEKWERICMPALGDDGAALWPERWPAPKLERIKTRYEESGYHWMWDALYQQRPPVVLDSEWDAEYFHDRIMFEEEPKGDGCFKVAFLDPSVGESSKSDYAAVTLLTVDRGGHVWVDAWLDRMDAWKQVDLLLAVAAANQVVGVGIEGNAFAKVLVGMFRRRCRELDYWPHIHTIQSTREKKMKIRAAVTPFLSTGTLHFKRRSPGVQLLLEQLKGFPGHKYDDGPDSLAMALELATHLREYGVGESSETGVEVVGI